MPPMGIWHPPPSAATSARSASSAASGVGVVDLRDDCAASTASSLRISMAMMPWPGAGTHSSSGTSRRDPGGEPQSPQAPRRPARADRTRPHPACAGVYRDSRARLQTRRPGTACAAARCGGRCPCRCAPGQSQVDPRIGWRFLRRRQNTSASGGSSRSSTAPTSRPSGSTAGMSLLLCTARSISPPSSASSISLTNSRLPPISESGRSCRRSPEVLMTTMSHATPPADWMRSATSRA